MKKFNQFINESNYEMLTGILQKDGSVLAEDGTIHWPGNRGTDEEGYPEILIDAKAVGGSGSWSRQSVKPYIGMKVKFVRHGGKKYQGYNFEIIKLNENNLVPDNIIDTFYDRIKKKIANHKDKNHPLVKKELERIKSINGKIPEKIQELLNEGVRDLMTPKSEEEIIKTLKNLTPNHKLFEGCKNGILWAVKESIEEGADIHYSDDLPLKTSSALGHTEIVQFLLDIGANIHAQSDYPIRYVSQNGYLETSKLLLDRGAFIYQDDIDYVNKCGHYEIAKLLSPYRKNLRHKWENDKNI